MKINFFGYVMHFCKQFAGLLRSFRIDHLYFSIFKVFNGYDNVVSVYCIALRKMPIRGGIHFRRFDTILMQQSCKTALGFNNFLWSIEAVAVQRVQSPAFHNRSNHHLSIRNLHPAFILCIISKETLKGNDACVWF